ncbi:MAG: hypothetical protein HY905_07325 [Deltaproteobacteria bacterium]|nr:hypothetical protein [Deltaproteobacteria bacterium]
MNRRRVVLLFLTVAGLVAAAGCPPPPRSTGVPRPEQTIEVGMDRTVRGEGGFRDVHLTVLPNNLALVREKREADIPTGVSAVEYMDVIDTIIPESTRVQFQPNGGDAEDVAFLEQRYRYDLIEPWRIMELSLGGTVRIKWTQARTGVEKLLEGVVESTDEGLFLRTPDGTYTLGVPNGDGWYSHTILDDLPGALFARPLLDWIVDVREGGPGVLETSYLAWGFSWEADYVITASEDFATADLIGWVTLRNTTAGKFQDAHLAVVAGTVNTAAESYNGTGYAAGYGMAMGGAEGDGDGDYGYVEEGLFEYHLYKLDQPTTLEPYSWKQVAFLERDGIQITTKYRADIALQTGAYGGYTGTEDEIPCNVRRVLTIENKADIDGLGIPLPAGTARVYARSGEDLFFIDSEQVLDTPREEPLNIDAGGAPFMVVKSKITDVDTSDAGAFGSYTVVRHELTAVNRGSHAATVLYRLTMPGAGQPYGYAGYGAWDARLERAANSSGPPLEEVESGIWEMERTLEPDQETQDVLVLRIHQSY